MKVPQTKKCWKCGKRLRDRNFCYTLDFKTYRRYKEVEWYCDKCKVVTTIEISQFSNK